MSKWTLQDDILVDEGGDIGEGLSNQPMTEDSNDDSNGGND